MITLIVDEDNPLRIDKYILEKLPHYTRSNIQKLIDEQGVVVNKIHVSKNYKVKQNDEIVITIPKPKELETLAQDIKLDIVYEDADLVVVNKPQGMVVHPACGNFENTLVNALLSHCKGQLSQINGVIRPGIVHRIDKDTSGLLLVAKNNQAHLSLAAQIKEHSVTRKYMALVIGRLKQDEITIDLPIGRNAKDRKKMTVTDKNSKNAVTKVKVIERFTDFTLVECELQTGRTHQIRVHMSYIGNPIVGDTVYGIKKQRFQLNGQLLHAYVIGFMHPSKNEYMEFRSDLPQYFKEVLQKLS